MGRIKGGGRLRHEAAQNAKKAFRDMEDDVTLHYCDKHQDGFVIVCMRLYALQAWKYINERAAHTCDRTKTRSP